jgi:excinuclease ABC subunit A
MEAWLDRVMVERTCPDCEGSRLRATRLCFTVAGRTLHDVNRMHFDELHAFLGTVRPSGAGAPAGRHVLKEIRTRLELLLGIGLDYLSFDRRAGTLSGGESQRVKIATELSRLQRAKHTVYILDEPTTGLHLADVERLLESLNRLVDAGHTVILIEHHLDVIKTADHVIDLGPEGGHGGGAVVATGTPEQVAGCAASHTGRFLKARLR